MFGHRRVLSMTACRSRSARPGAWLAVLLAAALGLGCGRTAPPPEPIAAEPATAGPERGRLQGAWRHRSIDLNGKAAAPAVAREFVYRFDGTRFTNSRAGQLNSQGTYTLDPSKSPPWIDFVETTGVTIYGIYRLDGAALTLCLHERRRPTEFESRPGQVRSLVVLDREGP